MSRAAPGTHRQRREPAATPATARLHRLIAGLQQRIGWLSGVSPRRLTSLHRFAAQRWTPRDVHRALDELLRARDWSVPERVENPPAYLACLLRGIDPADRPGAIEEAMAAEDAARRAWLRKVTLTGRECEHGHPAGDLPHPIDGHKACLDCRRKDTPNEPEPHRADDRRRRSHVG